MIEQLSELEQELENMSNEINLLGENASPELLEQAELFKQSLQEFINVVDTSLELGQEYENTLETVEELKNVASKTLEGVRTPTPFNN